MRLIESIASLLREDLDSIGVPEPVAEVFRDRIEYRKARDMMARWYKDTKNRMIRSDEVAFDIAKNSTQEERERVGKDLGIFYEIDETGQEFIDALADRFHFVGNGKVWSIWRKLADIFPGDPSKNDALKHLHRYLKEGASSFLGSNEILVEFLNQDRNNYRKFKGADLRKAAQIARDEMEERTADPSNIVRELSNGWYWYKLDSKEECKREGNLMGHCGRASNPGLSIYSLRDPQNHPHVTLEYSSRSEKVLQIRGKGNAVPAKKYWDEVKTFISSLGNRVEVTDYSAESWPEEIDAFLRYLSKDNNIVAMNPDTLASKVSVEIMDDVYPDRGIAITEVKPKSGRIECMILYHLDSPDWPEELLDFLAFDAGRYVESGIKRRWKKSRKEPLLSALDRGARSLIDEQNSGIVGVNLLFDSIDVRWKLSSEKIEGVTEKEDLISTVERLTSSRAAEVVSDTLHDIVLKLSRE